VSAIFKNANVIQNHKQIMSTIGQIHFKKPQDQNGSGPICFPKFFETLQMKAVLN